MSGPTFTNSTDAARRLGVPEAWLKREAHEGRLPAFRAGRRLLFDPDQVARVLADRAEHAVDGEEVPHAR